MNTVTIIGGGFGGVYAARRLLRQGFSIRLISRDDFFTFTPLLHEVATGTLRREDIAFPFATFFRQPRFEFVKGLVKAVDTEQRVIRLDDGQTLNYETLILATGACTDPGAISGAEHALTLKSVADALAIRCALERHATDGKVRLAVIGAGPTGVELVCEIRQLLKRKAICSAELLLFSGRRLPFENEHPGISPYIASTLERLQISFYPQFTVDRLEKGMIHGNGQSFPADITILTTGVRPATDYLAQNLKDKQGNIIVDDSLRVAAAPGVYALGDIISLPAGKPPALAQLAVQQARIVADNITRQLNGQPLRPYHVAMKGVLVSLGQWDAVGIVFKQLISGRIAWYIWRTVYLFKTPGFINKLRIAYQWTLYLFNSRQFFSPVKK